MHRASCLVSGAADPDPHQRAPVQAFEAAPSGRPPAHPPLSISALTLASAPPSNRLETPGNPRQRQPGSSHARLPLSWATRWRAGASYRRRVVAERPLMIALTDAQVTEVVRDASGGPRLAGLLAAAGDLEELRQMMVPLLADPHYSHSALRAVLVLAAFSVDGSEREVTEVAKALALSPSTTYRYLRTWVALGLLEQDPGSRRYRRASATGVSRSQIAPGTNADGR